MENSKNEQSKAAKPVRSTKFKKWCIKNGIQQLDIRKKTKLSIGCIHSTWNDGKATGSTIKLISLVYNINEAKLKKMITTFVKSKDEKKAQPTEQTAA